METQDPGQDATPPGWYPDAQGQVRWWDGQQWGPLQDQAPMPVTGGGGSGSDPKTMAMLAQLLGIFTGFLGPLIIYATSGDKDPFVKHHAAEALNFQITMAIAWVVTFALMFVLIGFLIAPVLLIAALVFEIQGTIAANRGEWWTYPINIRLVPGAQGV